MKEMNEMSHTKKKNCKKQRKSRRLALRSINETASDIPFSSIQFIEVDLANKNGFHKMEEEKVIPTKLYTKYPPNTCIYSYDFSEKNVLVSHKIDWLWWKIGPKSVSQTTLVSAYLHLFMMLKVRLKSTQILVLSYVLVVIRLITVSWKQQFTWSCILIFASANVPHRNDVWRCVEVFYLMLLWYNVNRVK